MIRHTPFHRRVLFWVFIIMFCAVSPAVIFYTAGYRWNPKKGAVERNGTIIVETTPVGARITLNGADLGRTSPVTQRDVAPGAYRIRLELAGYHPWEKVLNVQPERVTFVNDILLWPIATPQLQEAVEAGAISISANGRYRAYLRKQNGTFGVTITEVQSGKKAEFDFSTSTFDGTGALSWNENASALFIEDNAGRAWAVNRTGTRAISLPPGSYRWSGTELIGVSANGTRETIHPVTGVVSRSALSVDVFDAEGDYELIFASSSSAFSLRDRAEPDRRYALPAGTWRFASVSDDFAFLRTDGALLAFRQGASLAAPKILPASEDAIPLKIGGAESLLSVHENELWTMAPDADPALLIRKSVPIVGAVWHRFGRDLFYATPTHLLVMNLDPRDGRAETVLGGFDEIFGFVVEREQIVVSARKGDTRGLWTIEIE